MVLVRRPRSAEDSEYDRGSHRRDREDRETADTGGWDRARGRVRRYRKRGVWEETAPGTRVSRFGPRASGGDRRTRPRPSRPCAHTRSRYVCTCVHTESRGRSGADGPPSRNRECVFCGPSDTSHKRHRTPRSRRKTQKYVVDPLELGDVPTPGADGYGGSVTDLRLSSPPTSPTRSSLRRARTGPQDRLFRPEHG